MFCTFSVISGKFFFQKNRLHNRVQKILNTSTSIKFGRIQFQSFTVKKVFCFDS